MHWISGGAQCWNGWSNDSICVGTIETMCVRWTCRNTSPNFTVQWNLQRKCSIRLIRTCRIATFGRKKWCCITIQCWFSLSFFRKVKKIALIVFCFQICKAYWSIAGWWCQVVGVVARALGVVTACFYRIHYQQLYFSLRSAVLHRSVVVFFTSSLTLVQFQDWYLYIFFCEWLEIPWQSIFSLYFPGFATIFISFV